MAILGTIVKSAIGLKHSLNPNGKSPIQQQREQLRKLLTTARDTSLGIYYGFDSLLAAKDPLKAYQARVPVFEYDAMNRRWWRQQQLLPNISWPGKPDYFALSSGTTGKESKRIPVTKEMLDAIRSAGISQAEALARFDFPPGLFEKDILMLGSSTRLQRHENGHLEGEISGISTNNLPSWFGGFYKPGLEIAGIEDWDERVEAIARKAPEWDVGAIAGIPSWVQKMLQYILKYHRLNHIHELWPEFSIYVSGGVAFSPYRESFEKLLGQPIITMDTYLASEGFFAYTARPGTMAMKLAVGHGIFYEFIPFDERGFDATGSLLDDPLVLAIDEVEEGQDYALLVSTPAGAWRYMIGDTIRFVNLKEMEIIISGRTKYFLNVVGSQLSEEKINAAIKQLENDLGAPINEFAVAALKDEAGEFHHQWVVAAEDAIDEQEAARKLDGYLKELNKNYKVARTKALREVKLKAFPTELFYTWLESRKKKGGQIKMPRVMEAEKMEDFLAFADEQQAVPS